MLADEVLTQGSYHINLNNIKIKLVLLLLNGGAHE